MSRREYEELHCEDARDWLPPRPPCPRWCGHPEHGLCDQCEQEREEDYERQMTANAQETKVSKAMFDNHVTCVTPDHYFLSFVSPRFGCGSIVFNLRELKALTEEIAAALAVGEKLRLRKMKADKCSASGNSPRAVDVRDAGGINRE